MHALHETGSMLLCEFSKLNSYRIDKGIDKSPSFSLVQLISLIFICSFHILNQINDYLLVVLLLLLLLLPLYIDIYLFNVIVRTMNLIEPDSIQQGRQSNENE